MATDSPFGLRPVRTGGGAANNFSLTEYYIADDYGTALFVGDPVVVTGDGSDVIMQGRGLSRLSTIERAADTGAITGVIVGFVPNASVSDTVLHNPANTERIALVLDDPNAEFEIQTDGTFTAAMVGNNSNLVFTHAGSTATGKSGCELEIADVNTTATLQLKILRIADEQAPDEDNSIGANTNVVVRINNHALAPNTAGIA